jgi:hypothetical protein
VDLVHQSYKNVKELADSENLSFFYAGLSNYKGGVCEKIIEFNFSDPCNVIE